MTGESLGQLFALKRSLHRKSLDQDMDADRTELIEGTRSDDDNVLHTCHKCGDQFSDVQFQDNPHAMHPHGRDTCQICFCNHIKDQLDHKLPSSIRCPSSGCSLFLQDPDIRAVAVPKSLAIEKCKQINVLYRTMLTRHAGIMMRWQQPYSKTTLALFTA